MKPFDYLRKFNREGPSILEIALFLLVICGTWLLSVYFLNLDIYPDGTLTTRYVVSQNTTGLLEALFLFGLVLLGFALYVRSRETILYQEKWAFTLFRQKGNLYLRVLKGSVGTYEVLVKLTKEERRKYWIEGGPYIKKLVKKSRKLK
jgi:hypothetical protein